MAADAETDPALAGRPDGCQAKLIGDYVGCEKCGQAWALLGAAPACAPMTVGRFRQAMLRQIDAYLGSHAAVCDAKAAGLPADPAPALAHAMELSAAWNVLDRCLSDRRILDLLKGNQK